MNELHPALQLGDKPYWQDFPILPNSLEPGSMPADGLYELWMQTYKPTLAIEVGSFLGYSAIKMALEAKRLKLNTTLICVDSWLGSPEHYDMMKGTMQDRRLGYTNGYPTLYHKFVSNVIHAGVQDIIHPFPYPSLTASKILTKLEVSADFMFIDGDHSALGVYLDLQHYWPLLKQGGTLFGDDWAWESVRDGVTAWASENNVKINVLPNKVHWFMVKE
jgi:predicted O-methyltransferase YrrM